MPETDAATDPWKWRFMQALSPGSQPRFCALPHTVQPESLRRYRWVVQRTDSSGPIPARWLSTDVADGRTGNVAGAAATIRGRGSKQ